MIDAIMPVIQFVILAMLLITAIALRRLWNNTTVTIMACAILLSISLRAADELSNALFHVDILSVQSNWIVRWLMISAVVLFLLREKQLNRKAIEKDNAARLFAKETMRKLAERENDLRLLREEVRLESIRAVDQRAHASNWDNMPSMRVPITAIRVRQ